MASHTPLPTGSEGVELRARVEERLAGVASEGEHPAPISAGERAERRARLGRLLRGAGLDAFVLESGGTSRHLVGAELGRSERLLALVVTADGDLLWVTPAFEASRVERSAEAAGASGTVVAWDEHEDAAAVLAAELARRGARSLAYDPDVRVRFAAAIDRATDARGADGGELARELRAVKDEHELALMRRASELTQRAVREVAARTEPGMRTSEVAVMAHVAQERLGLDEIWDLTLAGPSGAFPHGDGVDREIGAGEVLLLDTGGSLHGYRSDTTRTWVVGAPASDEVRGVWDAVRSAQRAAFDALRPGGRCGDVDRAARTALADAGWDDGYRHLSHRLGHGIGLEVHEPPYLDGGSDAELRPGMVFTNEPGIYLPGRFGLRIEDVCVVTDDGADHFGSWQVGPDAP